MLLAIFTFAVGIVVGAYSHKWLASVTGAPPVLGVSNVVGAAVQAEQNIAKKL